MTTESKEFKHLSVLARELADNLELGPGDLVIDCTTGGGGHASEMLAKILPGGKLLAFDQDQDAISHLQKRFADNITTGDILLENSSFSAIKSFSERHGFTGKVSAIIADLGVSSHQIDKGERGFSFQQNGPLDMRMNQEDNPLTAKDVVNNYDVQEIADILYHYGEERASRRIARAIVRAREITPIETTTELVDIVRKSLPYTHSKKNPATKTFQALRIYVNKELDELKELLTSSLDLLKIGGRLAIITFHSLEDKLVKETFTELAGKKFLKDLPREIPLTQEDITSYNLTKGKIIKPFPIKPSSSEVNTNPRARSAKLRIFEKI